MLGVVGRVGGGEEVLFYDSCAMVLFGCYNNINRRI